MMTRLSAGESAFLADLAGCRPAGSYRAACGAGCGPHVPRPNHSLRSAIQPEIILQRTVREIVAAINHEPLSQ